MNILVLCTGNSARSILLESLLNTHGKGRINAYSAGSQPSGKVHPQSLILLGEEGHNTSTAASKSWDVFAKSDAPQMDLVVTVCGSAASETCPIWPGAPLRTHWGVEDPAAASQSDWEDAFRTAYDILKRRADAFLALDWNTLDDGQKRTELTRIGQIP
jgi:arsenate reductase